jgi:NAD(P)-dependent dehydrogenase (short-subunit alcohol dehydrogenase family)
VAIVDVDAGRAETVAKTVTNLGRNGIPIVGNVLDPGAAEQIIAEAEEKLGGLDILVAIVGQAQFVHFLDITPEQWELDINRNLRYFAFAAQAFARSLVRRGKPGAITAISSVSGLQSAPHHAAYGAAKGGLINLVKSLASELAEYNIRVNSVAPGSILTDRQAAAPAAAEIQAKMKASLVPFKRHGETDDIGNAVRFLSSKMANYISGHTLAVDGGWMSAYTLGNLLDGPEFAAQFNAK